MSKPDELTIIIGTLMVAGVIVLFCMIALLLGWPLSSVFQSIVLVVALVVTLFCFYKAYTNSRPIREFHTDVDLDDLDNPDLDDDSFPEQSLVQPTPATQEASPSKSHIIHTTTSNQTQEDRPETEPSNVEKQSTACFDVQELLKSPLHLAANLSLEKRSFLQNEGYLKKEFVPLGKTRREEYYI